MRQTNTQVEKMIIQFHLYEILSVCPCASSYYWLVVTGQLTYFQICCLYVTFVYFSWMIRYSSLLLG